MERSVRGTVKEGLARSGTVLEPGLKTEREVMGEAIKTWLTTKQSI